MSPIQATLMFLLAVGTTVFLAKLRATRTGRVLVLTLVLAALVLVVYPSLATRLAHALGVGRGVDLLIYLALLGQGFLILLLFSSLRAMGQKLTIVLRELALVTADNGNAQQGEKLV